MNLSFFKLQNKRASKKPSLPYDAPSIDDIIFGNSLTAATTTPSNKTRQRGYALI